jgi:ADP-ribosylglycohydrolase
MVDLEASQTQAEDVYQRLVELLLVDPYMNSGSRLEWILRDDLDYRGKFQGCMLGLAAGDALGKFGEMLSKKEIEERYGTLDTYPENYQPYATPGSITDDTQMSIWVAEHLLTHQGLQPVVLANKFISEEIRGIGAATAQFVSLLRDQGMPWYLSGWESAGNAGAMRAAPIALYHLADYIPMKRDAGMQTYITHRDQMAIAGSVLQATAVSLACHTSPGTLQDRKARTNYMLLLADSIRDMETRPYYNERYERDTLLKRITEDLPFFIEWSPEHVLSQWGNGPYVLESLPFALYCFLRSPEDFSQILSTAVNYGGDADTVASMACAIAGAYLGVDAIPESLLQGLEFKETLVDLADKMHAHYEAEVKRKTGE